MVNSSQAFDNPLWSSDLLLGHAEGLGHEGVFVHLGIVAHLNSLLSVVISRSDQIEARQ